MNAFLRSLTAAAFAAALALAPAGVAFGQGGTVQTQNGLPTGPAITGQDATSGLYFGTNVVGISGHLSGGVKNTGSVPVLSACGTSPVLQAGSTDTAGQVTMGTTATGCVITFGTAYAGSPQCTVTWQATPLASQSYTITAAAITTVQTSTSSNLLNYVCFGRSGG